eukprot:jgi/Tetstr1/435793/TSEL_024682.t1
MALTRRAGRCLAGIPAAWASFRLSGCLLLLLPGLAGALGWAAAEPWELEQGNSAEALASVVRQMAADPEVLEQPYAQLSPAALRQLAQFSPKWRKELEESHLPLSVEVILVGFNGDGNGGVALDEREVVRYLEALDTQLEWRLPRDPGSPLSEAALPVRFFFRVRHAGLHLSNEAALRVSKYVMAAPEEPEAATISHTALDSLLREDAESAELSYSLYLLNLPQPPRPYMYTYGLGGCPGGLWAGDSSYAWMDLTAGPAGVRPRGGWPRRRHAAHAAQRHRLGRTGGQGAARRSALQERIVILVVVRRGLAVELTALVHSMCKHLLVRPPAREPQWLIKRGLRVVLVRMTEGADPPRAGTNAEALRQRLQGLQLGAFPIQVEEVVLPLGECSSCVAAYTRALRSSVEVGEDGLPQATPYLDAAELGHWLSPLLRAEEHASYSAAEREVLEKLAVRPGRGDVVPVYILELSSPQPLLLDGKHQGAALANGVVVVHPRPAGDRRRGLPTGMRCLGAPVRVNPDLLTRPILAGLLEVVWGVQRTELEADVETGGARRNFLWSVGHDIFNPISQVASLSFAERDMALRNVLLPRLLGVRRYLTSLLDALEGLAEGRPLLEAVPRGRRQAFVQRTNFLLSQYTKAMRLLSLGHYNATHHLTMAMVLHDTQGLMEEAARVQQAVRTSLQCFREEGGPLGWRLLAALTALVALAAAVGAALRRRVRLSARKPKLF